jgi:hypothetical protein
MAHPSPLKISCRRDVRAVNVTRSAPDLSCCFAQISQCLVALWERRKHSESAFCATFPAQDVDLFGFSAVS